MAKASPNQIADKQISRLSGALEDVRQGVQRVEESPTARAAQNLDKMRANFIRALDSGKTKKRLMAVSLDDWKQRTLGKVDRIPQGVEAARATIQKFHEQRARFQEGIDRELSQIPSKTLQDNIRRATLQMSKMAEFSFDPGD